MNLRKALLTLSIVIMSPNFLSAHQSELTTHSKTLASSLSNPFVISAEKARELCEYFHLETEELLQQLIPIAQSYALPPISNYKVGAAALGKSGAIYLGVNLEFAGLPLNATVHAEQFLITLARAHGETELAAIAVSAAPCGHCRQFMNEMDETGHLQILIPGFSAIPLSTLLPKSFGPKDLGLSGNLLTAPSRSHAADERMSLIDHATRAASNSYAPYSDSKSGIAILTLSGKVYTGSYLENAAFNPSLSPLQAALITLVADMGKYEEIKEVILVEQSSAKITQEMTSREILGSIAPDTQFTVLKR